MKSTRFFCVAGVILCAALLASCATTTTAYVEGYEKNPSAYEVSELEWKAPLFGTKYAAWNGYVMERTKGYGSGVEVMGFSTAKKGASYMLSKAGAELYPVHVLYLEKGVSLPTLFHDSVTLSEATVALTTGNPPVGIPLADEDIILRDTSVVPLVVEKLRSSVQDGKVYKMWGGVSTGARLVVSGEEYAVVDYYSTPTRVLVNKEFSQQLTDTQRDYLASVLMGLYAYYKLLEQNGDTAGQTLSIVD